MVIPTMGQNDLNLTNPIVMNILNSLDIIHSWVKIHEGIFERFESKKNFGFSSFAVSLQYANVFKQILGIYVPTPS